MTAQLLDGYTLAARTREHIAKEVAALPSKPGLAAILVGDNPASKVYVGIKQKTCAEVGMESKMYAMPEETSEEELLALIEKLNNDEKTTSILVQLPVPKQIREQKIFEAISQDKDVDGFTFTNVSKLIAGHEYIAPCTPKGVITLLEEHGIEMAGKHAVVVGRSAIVGKPVAMMLLNRDATVTICHSRTANLSEYTKKADILVVAVGKPNMITGDMVKENAAVIDVGINRVDGKLVGDVDFESVKEKAAWISPVPKGVGPMTVAMLLQNTLELYRRQHAL